MTLFLFLRDQGVSAFQILLNKRVFELRNSFLKLPFEVFLFHFEPAVSRENQAWVMIKLDGWW